MKKILLVLPNDTLGGAEQILKMTAAYYSDAYVEVQFLKRKTNEEWASANPFIQLKYQNTKTEYWGALFFSWNVLVKPKKKYDCIFTTHIFVTGLVGILIRLGLLRKKHFIGRESTRIFERFKGFKLFLYKIMYQLGYPALDLLICQTQQMKQDLIAHLPWMNQKIKIKVIVNPVDLTPMETTEDLAIEFPFIVSAGRLIPEKGFDILIVAFKEITKQYPTHQLIILGEGKERPNLELQIKKLGLENKVILKGRAPNVLAYFKAAKVCVVSSRIEGFPNVLLQMMSQNSHVVSTKCVDEMDSIPGILVAEKTNALNLSSAILKALKNQHTNNSQLLKSFLEERTIENFITAIEEEFQS
jgi:glycosyltransferase involved in cell wall biosynthesis